MSRGLSKRQRQVLALLVTEKRSLDVTAGLLPALGLEATDSSRRSMLRALRLLERRGLVTLERVPSERGGWPRLRATARAGAGGELTGAELQRVRAGTPRKGTLRKGQSQPRFVVRRGPGRHWRVIDTAASQDVGFAVVTKPVGVLKSESAARRKADQLNAREH